MNNLGKYLEIMLTSRFPQSDLVNSAKFLRYLEDMNFKIKKKDLEYFDRERNSKTYCEIEKKTNPK